MSYIQHNLFSTTCCNLCQMYPTPSTSTTVKPAKLLKCHGCKLILYCSPSHQKLDWPIHKSFCTAVGTLMAEYQVSHLFKIGGPIRTQNDLCETIVNVKCKVVTLLNRPLDYHEEELTSFPIMCSVCFLTSYNKLFQCKGCNAVSYCCPEHEEYDALTHQTECLQLKIHYCKFKIEPNLTFNLEQKDKCELLKSDLPTAMAKIFEIKFLADPSEELIEYQKFSFVSDFSCIATISYVIEPLKKYHKLSKEFTLFIVGSTVDEIWFSPLHAEFFFACFPRVLKLCIVFIGPEIRNECVKDSFDVLKNGRSLYRTSFQGTIENFLQTNELQLKPDLIACFNCGFSENALTTGPSDSWYKGIEHLITLSDIPMVFTSYTNLEADSDLRALQQVIDDRNDEVCLKKIIGKQLNPYKDLRPLRNWQFNDPERIFFRNAYLHLVKFIHRC